MRTKSDEAAMDRVLVSGITGVGKTTLARELSARRGLLHQELDALHHGPGWVKRPDFESDVRCFSAQPRWVTEDQYHRFLGDLLWERSDTVIWLDLPRRTVMWRVVRRSLRRAITQAELWNGNRERWRDWLQSDHPVRWAWSQFSRRRTQTAERVARHPDVTVIRLRTAWEARRWLAGWAKRRRRATGQAAR
jgi:adenylate kinase family enzyme